MRQHRNIEVGGATLECTVYGSGTPVVLLANAGCSSGYFEDLARVLAAGGLQAISINMRGTGESRGSLEGTTVHDLAADVAGVLETMDCGPAHLVGHAFGNRIARCLAVDRPSLVRSVILLAAGGLIGPSTPLGTSFRNATEVKMNGSDCVTVLGARWLSPASNPKVLAQVECWPAVVLAHFATSRGMALEEWWGAGTAPLLVIQGLDDEAAPPANGHALREQFGERVRVIDLPRAGHFMLLEQPEAVTRAVAEFVNAGDSTSLTVCQRSRGAEMARYDDTFVDRLLEPWNRHDVDGALALMTDDCVWEVTRGREPHGTLYSGRTAVRSAIVEAFKALPDVHYQPVRNSFGEDHVVVELLVTGTLGDGRKALVPRLRHPHPPRQVDRRQAVIPEGGGVKRCQLMIPTLRTHGNTQKWKRLNILPLRFWEKHTVLSDDELGFADLASPGTIENLRHNSAIELNVVDPFTRRGFRFKGAAQVMKDPEAHGRIARVLGQDYPFEQVVKIRVETASEVFSPVYTLRRSSEADVRRFWLERYGYRSIRETGGAHDCPCVFGRRAGC